jgi:predicted transcriptional regulator
MGNKKHYRGNIEILRDILDAAREERIQNRIIFLANVNVGQLKRYSDALIECGYLEKRESSGNVRYQTTSEGLKTLKIFGEASTIMEKIKRRLK